MNDGNFNIEREEELSAVAEQLLQRYPNKRIFCFFGEMGAGKTTFIKALGKALCVQDNISSPTYSIINEYHTEKDRVVFHCDFYRLKNIEEAYDLGLDELFDSKAYCFIEWPEKIYNLLPEDYVRVIISVEEGRRNIKFYP